MVLIDFIQKLQNIFTNRRFFLRIYETSNHVIFWNDRDIQKKVDKKKLEDILQTFSISSIEKFADGIIQYINEEIHKKYSSDSNSKKVSIVIPNYNNELFIEKCINSILASTWDNLEVILVDDVSTDNSLEIVKSKFSNNPKIRIYENQKNMGAYYSRNKGIILANGTYILNVDGDDFIEPTMIEVCMTSANWNNWGYGTHFQRLYVKPDNIDKINHINRSNSYVFLFRRELFNRLGYYQESRFGADSEYIKRAKMIGGYPLQYHTLPEIFYNAYTISGKNLIQTISHEQRSDYINKCTKILKKKEYIRMSLLENKDDMEKNCFI
jgi:glycosyltransferase involved in cell wall biosynthesis